MEQEKTKNNKSWIIAVVILVVVAGYFYFSKNQGSVISGEKLTTPTFTDMGQPLSEDIVNCEFRVISNFVYENKKDAWSEENRKVYYDTSEESKPNLITFANISSKEPKIKGNMGDSPLTLLKNDNETVVLAEQNAMGDIFIYTIFKKEKIATWYKSYKMLVAPYGMLSMGYCY